MALQKASSQQMLQPVDHRQDMAPEAGRQLVDQLTSAQAQERRSAAIGLRGRPHSAPALVRALRCEAEPQVRSAILTTLSSMASVQVVAELVPLLRSDEASLRNGAMEVLATMPNEAAQHVAPLLSDPDPDVRLLTLQLLSEFAHPHVRDWLRKVLEFDDNLNVVASAVEVMAEVGQVQDIDLLQAVVDRFHGDVFIAFTVDVALSRMEAP